MSPGDLVPALAIVPLTAVGACLLCRGQRHWEKRLARERAARGRAEVALKNAHESLDQRVDARTAELRGIIEGLESFNRSVSHDLRGPLGGIAGLASLARARLLAGDLGAAERYLQMIQAQAENSGKLVGTLLALARAGDANLRIQRVSMDAVVREALEHLRLVRREMKLPVRVVPLPEIEADADMARQVFVNLLGNALKFSACAPRPQVEVGVTGGSDNPIIFVRDNGAGFSADEAQRLFRPFTRLHGGIFEGFGVGLSIVKRIIDRHGGMVWAQGEPGLGATFFFTFRP